MVIRQRLAPDRHRKRGVELLGLLKFMPRGRVLKTVQKSQAAEECRLGAARPGIRKVHYPELTWNEMELGMMLGARVARRYWLDGDCGQSDGKYGTYTSVHGCY
jgi:hypothetical protein